MRALVLVICVLAGAAGAAAATPAGTGVFGRFGGYPAKTVRTVARLPDTSTIVVPPKFERGTYEATYRWAPDVHAAWFSIALSPDTLSRAFCACLYRGAVSAETVLGCAGLPALCTDMPRPAEAAAVLFAPLRACPDRAPAWPTPAAAAPCADFWGGNPTAEDLRLLAVAGGPHSFNITAAFHPATFSHKFLSDTDTVAACGTDVSANAHPYLGDVTPADLLAAAGPFCGARLPPLFCGAGAIPLPVVAAILPRASCGVPAPIAAARDAARAAARARIAAYDFSSPAPSPTPDFPDDAAYRAAVAVTPVDIDLRAAPALVLAVAAGPVFDAFDYTVAVSVLYGTRTTHSAAAAPPYARVAVPVPTCRDGFVVRVTLVAADGGHIFWQRDLPFSAAGICVPLRRAPLCLCPAGDSAPGNGTVADARFAAFRNDLTYSFMFTEPPRPQDVVVVAAASGIANASAASAGVRMVGAQHWFVFVTTPDTYAVYARDAAGGEFFGTIVAPDVGGGAVAAMLHTTGLGFEWIAVTAPQARVVAATEAGGHYVSVAGAPQALLCPAATCASTASATTVCATYTQYTGPSADALAPATKCVDVPLTAPADTQQALIPRACVYTTSHTTRAPAGPMLAIRAESCAAACAGPRATRWLLAAGDVVSEIAAAPAPCDASCLLPAPIDVPLDLLGAEGAATIYGVVDLPDADADAVAAAIPGAVLSFCARRHVADAQGPFGIAVLFASAALFGAPAPAPAALGILRIYGIVAPEAVLRLPACVRATTDVSPKPYATLVYVCAAPERYADAATLDLTVSAGGATVAMQRERGGAANVTVAAAAGRTRLSTGSVEVVAGVANITATVRVEITNMPDFFPPDFFRASVDGARVAFVRTASTRTAGGATVTAWDYTVPIAGSRAYPERRTIRLEPDVPFPVAAEVFTPLVYTVVAPVVIDASAVAATFSLTGATPAEACSGGVAIDIAVPALAGVAFYVSGSDASLPNAPLAPPVFVTSNTSAAPPPLVFPRARLGGRVVVSAYRAPSDGALPGADAWLCDIDVQLPWLPGSDGGGGATTPDALIVAVDVTAGTPCYSETARTFAVVPPDDWGVTVTTPAGAVATLLQYPNTFPLDGAPAPAPGDPVAGTVMRGGVTFDGGVARTLFAGLAPGMYYLSVVDEGTGCRAGRLVPVAQDAVAAWVLGAPLKDTEYPAACTPESGIVSAPMIVAMEAVRYDEVALEVWRGAAYAADGEMTAPWPLLRALKSPAGAVTIKNTPALAFVTTVAVGGCVLVGPRITRPPPVFGTPDAFVVTVVRMPSTAIASDGIIRVEPATATADPVRAYLTACDPLYAVAHCDRLTGGVGGGAQMGGVPFGTLTFNFVSGLCRTTATVHVRPPAGSPAYPYIAKLVREPMCDGRTRVYPLTTIAGDAAPALVPMRWVIGQTWTWVDSRNAPLAGAETSNGFGEEIYLPASYAGTICLEIAVATTRRTGHSACLAIPQAPDVLPPGVSFDAARSRQPVCIDASDAALVVVVGTGGRADAALRVCMDAPGTGECRDIEWHQTSETEVLVPSAGPGVYRAILTAPLPGERCVFEAVYTVAAKSAFLFEPYVVARAPSAPNGTDGYIAILEGPHEFPRRIRENLLPTAAGRAALVAAPAPGEVARFAGLAGGAAIDVAVPYPESDLLTRFAPGGVRVPYCLPYVTLRVPLVAAPPVLVARAPAAPGDARVYFDATGRSAVVDASASAPSEPHARRAGPARAADAAGCPALTATARAAAQQPTAPHACPGAEGVLVAVRLDGAGAWDAGAAAVASAAPVPVDGWRVVQSNATETVVAVLPGAADVRGGLWLRMRARVGDATCFVDVDASGALAQARARALTAAPARTGRWGGKAGLVADTTCPEVLRPMWLEANARKMAGVVVAAGAPASAAGDPCAPVEGNSVLNFPAWWTQGSLTLFCAASDTPVRVAAADPRAWNVPPGTYWLRLDDRSGTLGAMRVDVPPAAVVGAGIVLALQPAALPPPSPLEVLFWQSREGGAAPVAVGPAGALLRVYLHGAAPGAEVVVVADAGPGSAPPAVPSCTTVLYAHAFWGQACDFVAPGVAASYRADLAGPAGAAAQAAGAASASASAGRARAVAGRGTARAGEPATVFVGAATLLTLECAVTAEPSGEMGADGAARVTVRGGSAPYVLSVGTAMYTVALDGGAVDATGLGGGVVTATVRDAGAGLGQTATCALFLAPAAGGAGVTVEAVVVGVPTGCGTHALTPLAAVLEPAGTPVVSVAAAAAGDAAVTECSDPRLTPVAAGDVPTVAVGGGTWRVFVCARLPGGDVVAATPADMAVMVAATGGTGVDGLPALTAAAGEAGRLCPVGGRRAARAQAIRNATIVVTGAVGTLAVWTPGGTEALAVVAGPGAGTQTALLPALLAGETTFLVEDARRCPVAVHVATTLGTEGLCGTCDAADTACLGCDGVPFSWKVVDECGVCGGANACLPGCVLDAAASEAARTVQMRACVAAGAEVRVADGERAVFSAPMTLSGESVRVHDVVFAGGVTVNAERGLLSNVSLHGMVRWVVAGASGTPEQHLYFQRCAMPAVIEVNGPRASAHATMGIYHSSFGDGGRVTITSTGTTLDVAVIDTVIESMFLHGDGAHVTATGMGEQGTDIHFDWGSLDVDMSNSYACALYADTGAKAVYRHQRGRPPVLVKASLCTGLRAPADGAAVARTGGSLKTQKTPPVGASPTENFVIMALVLAGFVAAALFLVLGYRARAAGQ